MRCDHSGSLGLHVVTATGCPSPPARRASTETGSELVWIHSKYGLDVHMEALYGDRGLILPKASEP